MRAVDVIRRKRDGGELAETELAAFVRAAATGADWEPYQLSALLMAIVWRGMTPNETATFTRLMADSGKRLDLSELPGPKVDKHSTGGVGDKTSLILAPLVAACGAYVPMMSGRGLGHTGGTLDKLESIPGFRVNLSEAEFRAALRATRIGMIGQTAEVAPADKTLYALRDVTGTVECIPLITASILSKKLAEGIDSLVMDVKCGRGAFMKSRDDARNLAEGIVRVARLNGLRCEALVTAMNRPLGRAVGNALEGIESLETLKGNGPADLTELSLALSARMVRLAGLVESDEQSRAKVRDALDSGRGLEYFRRMVEQQDGDPHVIDDYARLPTAPKTHELKADRDGFVADLDAESLGFAGMLLGGGRRKATDRIDPAVGFVVRAKPGDAVRAGDTVLVIHYRDDSGLSEVLERLQTSYTLTEDRPSDSNLVLEQIS
ncbi:MAG: thymidine phosphorylase [Planctomycetia bacterium]|nr:thymidine phosphorylase [Planctomycetia bacterium]